MVFAVVRGLIRGPRGLVLAALKAQIHTRGGSVAGHLLNEPAASVIEHTKFQFFGPLAPSDAHTLVVHSRLDGSRSASWPLELVPLATNDVGVFDLSGLAPMTRLSAVFEGAPAPASYSIEAVATPAPFRAFSVTAAHVAQVPAPLEPVSVRVEAHGFADFEVQPGARDLELVFVATASVGLALPAGFASIPEGMSVLASVNVGVDNAGGSISLPWNGGIRVPLARPGPLRVRFFAPVSAKRSGPTATIDVDEAALRGSAVLELPVDTDEWSSWLEAAARERWANRPASESEALCAALQQAAPQRRPRGEVCRRCEVALQSFDRRNRRALPPTGGLALKIQRQLCSGTRRRARLGRAPREMEGAHELRSRRLARCDLVGAGFKEPVRFRGAVKTQLEVDQRQKIAVCEHNDARGLVDDNTLVGQHRGPATVRSQVRKRREVGAREAGSRLSLGKRRRQLCTAAACDADERVAHTRGPCLLQTRDQVTGARRREAVGLAIGSDDPNTAVGAPL